jgi:hypothetical protein
LTQTLTTKQRKELQNKLAKALTTSMKQLSTELQKIMLDDLVTAFQNRLKVLNKAQKKRSY